MSTAAEIIIQTIDSYMFLYRTTVLGGTPQNPTVTHTYHAAKSDGSTVDVTLTEFNSVIPYFILINNRDVLYNGELVPVIRANPKYLSNTRSTPQINASSRTFEMSFTTDAGNIMKKSCTVSRLVGEDSNLVNSYVLGRVQSGTKRYYETFPLEQIGLIGS